MSAPRTRKPRDIETFRERRAKKRRGGVTVDGITVKLTFDASDICADHWLPANWLTPSTECAAKPSFVGKFFRLLRGRHA